MTVFYENSTLHETVSQEIIGISEFNNFGSSSDFVSLNIGGQIRLFNNYFKSLMFSIKNIQGVPEKMSLS